MDAIVSDISAFRYWRIPPLVRLLVSGSEDDALLQSIVTEEGLTRLRQGCAQLPLVREPRENRSSRNRALRQLFRL